MENQNSKSQAVAPTKETKPVYFSPYTGEQVEKESLSSIPFMVIIENSKDARPQSGLQQADIIYETMAEGGIPRFIALYQKNSPNKIGPVRSVRPYFIDLTKEYGLPFAHCGGSDEALEIIKKQGLLSLNEMSNGSFFWRDSKRKAPHNLYTSSEKLREFISEKKYIKPSSTPIKFVQENNTLPSPCTNLEIKTSSLYKTSYEYKNGSYYKSMDGVSSIDEETNEQLFCSNVVIEITKIITQKDGLHLTIPLTGQGECYVISGGKYTKGNWTRNSLNAQTTLKDESGNNIPLSPGKTWWHIVDKSTNITLK